MERLWRIYVRGLQVLCAALLTWIVGVTLVNVSMRYVFSRPIVWADESARLSFVIFTFLAAGLAAAGRGHLAIDSLERLLEARSAPASISTALLWLGRIAGVVFGLLLIVGGWTAARNNLGQLSPALRIPMGWIYMAMPVGGLLIVIGQIGDVLFPNSRAYALASQDASPQVEPKDKLDGSGGDPQADSP